MHRIENNLNHFVVNSVDDFILSFSSAININNVEIATTRKMMKLCNHSSKGLMINMAKD